MTELEMMQEALEWQKHITSLAGKNKDEKLYQRRAKTLEWLIKQAEKVLLEVDKDELRKAVQNAKRIR